VQLEFPEDCNIILGQSHFIKTVEDLFEVLVTSSPSLRFGIAFCEASGDCLIRRDGNDEELVAVATANAEKIAGDFFGVRRGHRHQFFIVSVPPDETVSGSFAEGDSKTERRRRGYEDFEKILHGLDKVALPKDDIAVLGELQLHKGPPGDFRHGCFPPRLVVRCIPKPAFDKSVFSFHYKGKGVFIIIQQGRRFRNGSPPTPGAIPPGRRIRACPPTA
jgi:hypothetical protein